MSRKRNRRYTTLTIAALILLTACATWGYPAAEHLYTRVTGHLPVGPKADTEQAVAELDREVQEIGRQIREQQAEVGPVPAGRPAWPAPGFFGITSDFGSRVHPVLNVPKQHTGLDIGATQGSQVVACLSGRVIRAEMLPAYGQIVVIDHGGKVSSVYAHLSAVSVQVGDLVERGDNIGRVGATGAVTGPHLHFEVRQDGEPVDPGAFLGGE